MSAAAMVVHLLLEQLTRDELPRRCEDSGVMDDPAQVDAYALAGEIGGLLEHAHFFFALLASASFRPQAQVLDLGCGPANQLAWTARLHPDCRFVGVDAAGNMLRQGRKTMKAQGIGNVELFAADMRCLPFADASIDAVMSTWALHHLADQAALRQTLAEVRRVLKPDGGYFFADFGRLKRRATLRHFVEENANRHSPQFIADYSRSLQAAFSVGELCDAMAMLSVNGVNGASQFRQTRLAPFLLYFAHAPYVAAATARQDLARQVYQQLGKQHQRMVRNLFIWFNTDMSWLIR